ncbi:hypothetical protein [Thalassomonas sp. RHCl1]|nr:hypothetical protein [Thalassomonas sp. RHCl1]
MLVEFISVSGFALFCAPIVGYLVALQLITLIEHKAFGKNL